MPLVGRIGKIIQNILYSGQNLKAERGVHDLDGVAMTKMIFHCMDYYTVKRPTMSQIVQWLQGLHVFNGVFGVVEGCLQEWDSNTFTVKKKSSNWKGCLKKNAQ